MIVNRIPRREPADHALFPNKLSEFQNRRGGLRDFGSVGHPDCLPSSNREACLADAAHAS
jgi:hypothetical protein